MIDLERVKEKAENIYNFYLDSNWEISIYLTANLLLFARLAIRMTQDNYPPQHQ